MLNKKHNIIKPKAIIFDWDNTLADSWLLIHTAINRTFADFSLPTWDLITTKKNTGRSARDFLPKYFGKHTEKAIEIYRRHYFECAENGFEIFDNVKIMLELLQSYNVPYSVVSNKYGLYLRRDIEKMGLTNYFHQIIGAGDAAEDKPSLDPVYMALEGLEIELGQHIWFVGDSDIDLECAKKGNMTAVLYGTENYQQQFIEQYKIAANVDNHLELIELIKNYCG